MLKIKVKRFLAASMAFRCLLHLMDFVHRTSVVRFVPMGVCNHFNFLWHTCRAMLSVRADHSGGGRRKALPVMRGQTGGGNKTNQGWQTISTVL